MYPGPFLAAGADGLIGAPPAASNGLPRWMAPRDSPLGSATVGAAVGGATEGDGSAVAGPGAGNSVDRGAVALDVSGMAVTGGAIRRRTTARRSAAHTAPESPPRPAMGRGSGWGGG